MAPLSKLVALVAGVGLCAAHKKERSEFVAAVQSGSVPKSQVELVLAQHDEDVTWSDAYSAVRTVYCKGKSCGPGSVRLPNVGREGHTFLHHIVQNYDGLSDWTVFSQAERPEEGYFGHGKGGGHLLTGSSIEDFLAHNDETEGKDDSLFLITSKVHLPTMAHALRSSFKTGRDMLTPSMKPQAACPEDKADDTWNPFHATPNVRQFVERKCSVDDLSLSSALEAFWQDFVQLPMPANQVVHYAQGARFAVSRDRIHQRSKDFYKSLLDSIAEEEDPCLNYLFEWAWYYIIGRPSVAPCDATADDEVLASAENMATMARMLDDNVGGMSGGAGVSGDGMEPNETVANETVVIKGHVKFMMDSALADEFVANESNTEAMEGSIAKAAMVPLEWVEAVLSVVPVDTRLRRLQSADATVVAEYSITVPPESQGDMPPVNPQTVVDAIMAPEFKAALEAEIAASTGVMVTVSEVPMPSQEAMPDTTVAPGAVDGAARTSALFAMACVAVSNML